jgi:2,4-dienoyl-CoA reductase-like NADH-dependent reductase (Old Yellow Enzyme family)
LSRVVRIIKDMGAVPAIQLGHTERRGSEKKPWRGKTQLPASDPDGWQVRGPSPIPHGRRYTLPVQELSIFEINEIHKAYASAARRAYECGLRVRVRVARNAFRHGYLGASFFSPLGNQRTDGYGGSREKRLRFHREALEAVRTEWPAQLPLTIRFGSDDFNEHGIQFDDAVWAIGQLKQHGLDFADISLGMNTDDMKNVPFDQVGFMVDRATRVRQEVGLPVGVSWNLGIPAVADRIIRQKLVDLVFLGRPALANPHWPVWAARELAHSDPFSLIPEDWAWWIRNRPGPEGSLGWPPVERSPCHVMNITRSGSSRHDARFCRLQFSACRRPP